MTLHGDQQMDYESFKTFCKKYMTEGMLTEIEKNTRQQSQSRIWEEMWYGRITASKVYDSIRCVTYDGVLVENILGAKFFETNAMDRGLDLEEKVLKVLEEYISKKFQKCGVFLSADCPVIGASPDVGDNCVVEIKSPMFGRTMKSYLDDNGDITSKFLHQIQVQMHLSRKQKAIFVVADPSFETNITFKTYDYDATFVKDVLTKIVIFWEKAIFCKI